MIKFCSLASGSNGNSAFFSSGHTRILIDNGLSRKELSFRLQSVGESIDRLDGIIITHGHNDHVSGLASMARDSAVFYMSEGTVEEIDWKGKTPNRIETFNAGAIFFLDGIECHSFPVPHDAVEPCGFRLTAEGIQVAICTDLGHLPEAVRAELRPANVLLLEANYDADILAVGPHPRSVQQRIKSSIGHLDNLETMDFLEKDVNKDSAAIMLGHMSASCNHWAIVKCAAEEAMIKRLGANNGPCVQIVTQNRVGPVVQL